MIRGATAPAAPWRWAGAGLLCGALVALTVFAPAAWLAVAVTQASSGHLQLLDARGTLWDGSARLVLTGGSDSRDASALPGRVGWRLRPGLQGMQLALHADCCTPQPLALQLTPRWGGFVLRSSDSHSQWPATLLSGLGTPWNTLQPEGVLGLSSESLSVEWIEGRLRLSGSARVEATDISSRLSTLRPMGSYRITVRAAPAADASGYAAPQLELQTLQGALQLHGSGQWVGSRLRFQGEASAAPEREAALANLLNIIGRRDGARTLINLG